MCSVTDLIAISRTCTFFNTLLNSDYFWKLKWPSLLRSSNLQLPNPSTQNKEESYRSCSQRLFKVCFREGPGLNSLPPKCVKCGVKCCSLKCKEVENHKLAIDIGSKTTWLMTSGFFLERHPSLLVIPESEKLSHNHDQKELHQITCLLCQHELVSASEKESRLKNTKPTQKGNPIGPTNDSQEQTTPELKSPVLNHSNPLMQHKFKLWSEISFMLKDANIDHLLLHPAQCFNGLEDFKYLEQYIYHLLCKFKLLHHIRSPNSTLVFCEPFDSGMELRKKISKFLIEQLQVTKICFLNKGLASAMLFQVDTCLVIDSGARNTVVTVIIDGEVQSKLTQNAPIGGTEISQRLATAVHDSGLKSDVYLPSLDSSRVKSRCYLSLNPGPIDKRGPAVKRKVFVRCKNDGAESPLEEIELGSELYLAPEAMYLAMDLPDKLKEALKDLDNPTVQELLSHILLTGSNTELKGFSTRLARDLRAAFPKQRHTIFIRSNGGSHSWDAVTGAMHLPMFYEYNIQDELPLVVPGSYMWVTREDYILKGDSIFTED